MKIIIETTPYDFLKNDSWECEYLAEIIDKHDCKDSFNTCVEEYFNGQIPSKTELNDFMRFNLDEILDWLGIWLDDETEEGDE